MTSRWVVVDDTDGFISYDGPWFADKGSLNNIGNFGAPYLNTSHGINSTGSFSYIFVGVKLSLFNPGENVFEACVETGSRVIITGSTGPDTQTSVSWGCVVDDGLPSNMSVNGAVGNNLRLCEQDGLSDTIHVLTVNVQATDGATFWLDYIKYLPTASTNDLENAAMSIDSTDVALNFEGWTSNFSASATGARLSFNFIGISLLYYAYFDPWFPVDSSKKTASYSIDGEPPVPFDVLPEATEPGFDATSSYANTLLFNTGSLPAGPHILDVTYLGTSNTTPLTFQFLVVQNRSTVFEFATSSTTSISSASSSTEWGIQTYSLLPASSSLATSSGISTNQSSLASMLALAGVVTYYLLGSR